MRRARDRQAPFRLQPGQARRLRASRHCAHRHSQGFLLAYDVMDGNQAAAYVSYAFTEVAGIFPITPSSPMAELVDEWSANGKKNVFGQRVRVVGVHNRRHSFSHLVSRLGIDADVVRVRHLLNSDKCVKQAPPPYELRIANQKKTGRFGGSRSSSALVPWGELRFNNLAVADGDTVAQCLILRKS